MANKLTGSDDEALAFNTYVRFTRAAEALSLRIDRIIASYGLTTSQFGTLEVLHHNGTLNQGEIASKILKSSGNMTMVIDNLEKRGLVERKRSTEDRRQVMVSLTNQGSKLIGETFPNHVVAVAKEMSILNEAEQTTLGKLATMLGAQSRNNNNTG